MPFADAVHAILAVGGRLDRLGLAPATAGNYSVRLADGTMAITVSGAHKGRLTLDSVMRASMDGASLDGRKPSAETLLHALVYEVDRAAGAVLHSHSVAGTVLSRALADRDVIAFQGYELQKIFPGVDHHDMRVALPLVDNSQDMVALAAQLRPLLQAQDPLIPAFFIRGHGLYAWAATIDAAEHLVEACEFLLNCAWEEAKLNGGVR